MSGRRNGDNGPGGKGSVRRARERAETGAAPDPAQLAQVNADVPARQPPPAPAAFKSMDQDSKGSVISRPTPMPQWPLPGTRHDKTPSPDGRDSPPRKGPAPKRPPRPGNVPSILDASKVKEYTPNLASRNPPQQQRRNPPNNQPTASNNGPSPPSTSESITSPSDAPSTASSSVGTIPDFPLPTLQAAQASNVDNGTIVLPPPPPPPAAPPSGRKSLGPPPSSRRGNTSFYSASSYVTPIPEELNENSPRNTRSYASSKVMPSSWGSTPAASDILNAYDYTRDDDDGDDEGSDFAPSIHDGNDDDEDGEVGLVRQASLGKRGKPSLRTINKSGSDNGAASGNGNVDPLPKGAADLQQNNGQTPSNGGSDATIPASAYSGLRKEVNASRQHKHQRSYSSSSESSEGDLEKPPIPKMAHPTLKELELEDLKGGQQGRRLSKREIKRPPRLDIDAVREAEERGSLTSLPDLIRRATRLAGNLDRGRTASRLGILDMLNGSGGDLRGPPGQRHSGSISDILASFPPPGAVTPSGDLRQFDRQANPDVTFPDDHPDAQRQEPRRRRQCCGMSRRVFIWLCVVLVLIVAAAVVLLVMFVVVLPRQREADNAEGGANQPVATDTCVAQNPCQNNGVSIGSLDADTCGCVCVDGFSGSDCSVGDDGSCTTFDVSGSSGEAQYQNATLGSALPRLFESAEANFSIPLDASRIVSLFNSEDVSCTSENAIVTFNGLNQRRHLLVPGYHGHDPITRRGALEEVGNPEAANNVEEEPAPPSSPTPTSSPPSATTTSTPSPSTSSPPVSDRTLDFARIAVLFILQETSDFKDATTANESIQKFFTAAALDESDSDVDSDENEEIATEDQLGGGSMDVKCDDQQFQLDFVKLSITLANGTVVGGTGAG